MATGRAPQAYSRFAGAETRKSKFAPFPYLPYAVYRLPPLPKGERANTGGGRARGANPPRQRHFGHRAPVYTIKLSCQENYTRHN